MRHENVEDLDEKLRNNVEKMTDFTYLVGRLSSVY